MAKQIEREEFGPNEWLVDEMYRRYQENPKAVGESWQEFFADYAPRRASRPESTATTRRTEPDAAPAPRPPAESPEAPTERPPVSGAPSLTEAPEGATPLKGVAARIAENMEASVGVPTATSVRTMPAKLLEENRRVINRSLGGGIINKISFTHVIGWAVLKGLEARPGMKASYADVNGKPHLVQNKSVNFGLAVDVQRPDGRVLYVPNIKDADQLDFADFVVAYEELIRRVRDNELKPDDFTATTITLTNPGTVGTTLSVPRLMPSQGLIVGTGAIAFPNEYEAADPRQLARLGVSKVLTVTSTYDHRVIQGAESGEFLSYIHELLLGAHRFYDEIFASLEVPYQPARWSRDRASDDTEGYLEKQSRVIQLINMYRVRGHLLAKLNPLGWELLSHPELDFSHYGLTVWDLDREFITDGLPGPRKQPLRRIIDTLQDAYSRKVGIEYMHIPDPEQKHWIQQRIEVEREEPDLDEKKHILSRLSEAEAFERFLHSKYTGHKRFSLEGAESLIPMLDALCESAADNGMLEIVMGHSHRGRLNVLTNIMGKPLREIFKEFEGNIDPDSVQGSGDVKYHLGMTGRFTSRAGNNLGLVLASNPSHLEAVDPVVEGMVRAGQDMLPEDGVDKIIPLLLHGDAAFAGQGVVAETFNMSQLPGYRTGGTVHVVVNNNIGFTTAPTFGRSTTYATDIAKMVQAPILHVNGDEPEECVRIMRLAFDYRQRWHRDVVVDLVCYRRHGHNEADEPAFTQPLMYSKIQDRRSVRKLYTEHLLNTGQLSVEDAEKSLEDFRAHLQKAFEATKEGISKADARAASPPTPVGVLPPIPTGVGRDRLERVHAAATSWPDDFEPHPKLKKQLEKRRTLLERDTLDWSAGETLAFGTLLLEGIPVRLAGQDSRRGTFSQRHSVLVDFRTGEEFTPLNHIGEGQAIYRAHDSLLSEFAAVGFEYGYSVTNGDALVCWEGQFGDFVNGAQIIVDQFIVAGEDKWAQRSRLVMLLPHGYEGQGPEHSSARLERFLTLGAEDSIQIAQPTTPAQYFHLLRRQMYGTVSKPLIVMTPKSLLRNPAATSPTGAFIDGHFKETLDDPQAENRDKIRRILLCTGKVAYELADQRTKRNHPSAIVRLEQLYPFPSKQLEDVFAGYPNATQVRWVQEEPVNMGAWDFVNKNLSKSLDGRFELSCAARAESASPATGSAGIHKQEQEELMDDAFRD
ncbi:MAG: multifunctional oxoglutarate decarboxylase/oxoglutarate dehydrogenase thiamine pyrophosphate-binding subunit/dihydrolipoyllysine-residue succinyltransferase subunit [Actinobacteria bacterium]|nr:multifunctional oxoglutarate decarboxylase/oxoglutarate dehydrogenase thiamine pyrophosphate-binding subunit/dihydrolipoyllysine-residue succinyltransferase subunit [Actinomycetota bacterium]